MSFSVSFFRSLLFYFFYILSALFASVLACLVGPFIKLKQRLVLFSLWPRFANYFLYITCNINVVVDGLENIPKKPCVIISFLVGNKVDHVTINHCKQVGEIISSLHKLAEDFDGSRANGLHQAQWRNLFQKCKKILNHQYKEIIQPIEEELDFLDRQWPSDLPKGIIHADVFHDNVFFKNNVFSGLIDFYFSCNDFFAYEIALTINAWCFNNNGQFDFDKFQSLIDGYQIHRVLNGVEKNSMSILLRGATMRILLTRLHDQLYHPEGAFVIPKNPLEYFLILKFHQNNLIFKDN